MKSMFLRMFAQNLHNKQPDPLTVA
jgi:hypothetical protein